MMSPTGPAAAGDIKFTDVGDVEIFDGESWVPVASILSDPDTDMRGLPEAAPRPVPPPLTDPPRSRVPPPGPASRS